ncbi:hypothetical protein SLA2020_362240 [Shorea laevis]
MNALDNAGKAWSFPCSLHHDETTGTVVSVCWDEFVREKGVRANAKVVLKEQSMAEGTISEVGDLINVQGILWWKFIILLY